MTTETTDAPATAEAASRWEDFIDVVLSPGELFDRRALETWVKTFVILSAVGIALYYLLLPINGMVWEAAMIENAPEGASAEQIQRSAAIMRWVMGIFTPIFYFFMIAVAAVLLKLVSAVVEPAAGWRQSFLIATLSMLITVPQTVLGSIAVFVKNSMGHPITMYDASFGPLRFMSDVDPVLRTVLARFDLFAIWTAVLLAIGLMHLVRMPRSKALLTAAIVWAASALPGLASAALFGNR